MKLDDHHVLLTTRYESHGHSFFTVDETITMFHVTITGKDPQLWIYDPHTKIVNGTETVNLDYVKSRSIENPMVGEWKIEYVMTESHSVRVTADSRLSFSYGFSILPANSLSETVLIPLNGKTIQIVSGANNRNFFVFCRNV